MKSLLATVPDKVERVGQDLHLRVLVKDGGFWTTRWPPTYKPPLHPPFSLSNMGVQLFKLPICELLENEHLMASPAPTRV